MKELKFKQFKGETRQEYLVRCAIAYIESHTGYSGVDDTIHYDDAECDGYALAEDLRIEFDIDETKFTPNQPSPIEA